MIKKTIKITILIGLIVVGGYYLFQESFYTLSSADTNSDLDVTWVSPKLISNPGATNTLIPQVLVNNTILTIDAVLDYPGAYVDVLVYIQNNSKYKIKVTDIFPNNEITSDIIWSFDPYLFDKTLSSGEKEELIVRIERDPALIETSPISQRIELKLAHEKIIK